MIQKPSVLGNISSLFRGKPYDGPHNMPKKRAFLGEGFSLRIWHTIKETLNRFLFPNRIRVVKRYSLARDDLKRADHGSFADDAEVGVTTSSLAREKGTMDEASILLENLAIRLQRDIRFDLPFEVTVVVPRAEITKRYENGNLVETSVVYSGITISHSPRYPPRKGLRS